MPNVSNIQYNGTTYGIEGVTDATLTISGRAADAAAVGAALARGSGLTEEAKQALLACFAQVAWIGDDGQDYYDALEAALYPPRNLVSISAVYTQSGTVYDTDTLAALKPDLVVTAHYDDSTTAVVTGYTLSGTLTVGTSTITVSYNGKTTTFNVTVAAPTMLFKDGNEYTAITGGYNTTGFNTGTISHTEGNDGEYLSFQYNATVSHANARALSTANKIDLTNFNKIVCVVKSYMPNGAGNLWLYYSSTIANGSTADAAYGTGSSDRRFWMTGANGWTSADENDFRVLLS